jgi:hypothetical protein
MQVKITVGYHLTPVEMCIIKNRKDNQYYWECEDVGGMKYLYIVGGVGN